MEKLNQLSDLLVLADKAISNKELRKELSYKVGYFDKGNRYHINEEFTTESSDNIRGPSRKWNLSEWKHTQTTKYLKQLKSRIIKNMIEYSKENQPELWNK